jgi:hypothetical protein
LPGPGQSGPSRRGARFFLLLLLLLLLLFLLLGLLDHDDRGRRPSDGLQQRADVREVPQPGRGFIPRQGVVVLAAAVVVLPRDCLRRRRR